MLRTSVPLIGALYVASPQLVVLEKHVMNIPASYLIAIGGFSGVLAAVCAVYFAWQNTTSQELVLTVAAFVGAFVLLAIKLGLEMRGEESKDLVTAEYTFDGLLPEMASGFYADTSPGFLRGVAEKESSADRARSRSETFKESPEILAQDMALASLTAMLFSYRPDWQLRPIVANARYTFGSVGAENLSKDDDCTKVDAQNVSDSLNASRNLFANIRLNQWGRDHICLPPSARLIVGRHHLRIETPQCSMSFTVKPPTGRLFGAPNLIKPGQSRVIDHVKLQNGEPRYINMPVPIELNIKYHAIYSKHRDMGRIRTWVTSITKASHDWFEGSGNTFMQLASPLEKNEVDVGQTPPNAP